MRLITTILITTGLVWAQADRNSEDLKKTVKAEAEARAKIEMRAKIEAELLASKMDLSSAQFGSVGGIVKGAPYSAEAVTESTQVLADGNRIRQKTSFSVFRDGEGRTARQEEQGGSLKTAFILDPVANLTYTFDHKSQTAYEHPLARAVKDEWLAKATASGTSATSSEGLRKKIAIMGTLPPADGQYRTEPLPKRTIEGLLVEGTRGTKTIPAGAVGNERPIEITSERWYSPDLQMDILTQRHDPRTGDVTFQLTRIQRGEPSRSVLEVPPGYTVQKAPAKKAIQ